MPQIVLVTVVAIAENKRSGKAQKKRAYLPKMQKRA